MEALDDIATCEPSRRAGAGTFTKQVSHDFRCEWVATCLKVFGDIVDERLLRGLHCRARTGCGGGGAFLGSVLELMLDVRAGRLECVPTCGECGTKETADEGCVEPLLECVQQGNIVPRVHPQQDALHRLINEFLHALIKSPFEVLFAETQRGEAVGHE